MNVQFKGGFFLTQALLLPIADGVHATVHHYKDTERLAKSIGVKSAQMLRTDNRLFVEAVLWMARTGTPWCDLPVGFGPWNTVFRHFSPSFAKMSTSRKCFSIAPLYGRTSTLPEPPKKRATKSWPFSWGPEHKDSCGSRWSGQSGALPSDRLRATRHPRSGH